MCEGDAVSLAQLAGVHNINYLVLGEHCGESLEAGMAVGVLSSTSRSNNYGLGQVAVVTRTSGVHTLSCRGQLQVPL